MATAWVFTLPAAALVGAAAEGIARAVSGTPGVIIDLVILLAVVAAIYIRSRKGKVDPTNVNDEWTGPATPTQPEPAAA
jgi:PiT family inorganic phosphate transporter